MSRVTEAFRILTRQERLRPLRSLYPPEAADADIQLIESVRPFTLLDRERLWFLRSAVAYVDRAALPGAIVECGVWRGGAMLLAKSVSATQRQFWLYDTFAGMSGGGEKDISFDGRRHDETAVQTDDPLISAKAVRKLFEGHGLDDDSLVIVEGPVEKTLSQQVPDQIAILRLDTDFYASTKLELETLYPRLVSGGILIIDDYGSWQGSRAATDEYFGNAMPLLTPVRSSRICIKL